jgi:hypothetical protein
MQPGARWGGAAGHDREEQPLRGRKSLTLLNSRQNAADVSNVPKQKRQAVSNAHRRRTFKFGRSNARTPPTPPHRVVLSKAFLGFVSKAFELCFSKAFF